MKEVVILQHVASETAGTILDYLKERSIPHRSIGLYQGDPLPEGPDSVGGAIIMGGPMNVDEDEKFPFLREEKRFIKDLIARNVPCFGVCLGAQLIARALGARVYKAARPEIGWEEVVLTVQAKKDPLFSTVKDSTLRVLQWHEDTFDLPDGATRLASSTLVPNQAYCYGGHVYGLQFHVEVDRPMLEDWFKGRDDLGAILRGYEDSRKKLAHVARGIYGQFFEKIVHEAEEEVETDGGGWCV